MTYRLSAETPPPTLEAPITAGSTATFSSGLAVQKASKELQSYLLDLASTFLEVPKDSIYASQGFILSKGNSQEVDLHQTYIRSDARIHTRKPWLPSHRAVLTTSSTLLRHTLPK